MLRSKFVKFHMSILKWQVHCSPNFVSLSVSWKITPLYFFNPNNICFAQKEPIKVKNFETFESSLQKLSNSLCQLETASRFLSKFCILIQFHEIKLLYTFLAQDIYTLLKRSPLKWKLLRLSSVQVKICQFPYANFEATSRFLSKFCILIQFYER